MLKIQIIIGSTRESRFSPKPAKWIFELAKTRTDIEVELVDLKDYPLPFFNEPISPAMSKEPLTNEVVISWTKKVAEADGYIIVTPEYNHGYPAVLKNALDYVYKEWNNKPVGFLSYGGISAGTRAVQQLRQVAIELQMVPIRNGIHIPMYWTALDENGELKTDSLKAGAEAFLDQLTWWAKVLSEARSSK